jgi:hypothetical protein
MDRLECSTGIATEVQAMKLLRYKVHHAPRIAKLLAAALRRNRCPVCQPAFNIQLQCKLPAAVLQSRGSPKPCSFEHMQYTSSSTILSITAMQKSPGMHQTRHYIMRSHSVALKCCSTNFPAYHSAQRTRAAHEPGILLQPMMGLMQCTSISTIRSM